MSSDLEMRIRELERLRLRLARDQGELKDLAGALEDSMFMALQRQGVVGAYGFTNQTVTLCFTGCNGLPLPNVDVYIRNPYGTLLGHFVSDCTGCVQVFGVSSSAADRWTATHDHHDDMPGGLLDSTTITYAFSAVSPNCYCYDHFDTGQPQANAACSFTIFGAYSNPSHPNMTCDMVPDGTQFTGSDTTTYGVGPVVVESWDVVMFWTGTNWNVTGTYNYSLDGAAAAPVVNTWSLTMDYCRSTFGAPPYRVIGNGSSPTSVFSSL